MRIEIKCIYDRNQSHLIIWESKSNSSSTFDMKLGTKNVGNLPKIVVDVGGKWDNNHRK